MKKYVSSMLAGALALGLVGCGSSSSSTKVTLADLNATGATGYHINVDLDFANNTYDASNIDYYFCTDAVGTYDYYAYTQDRVYGSELLVDEPDFDYGYLDYVAQSGILEFTSDQTLGLSYEVASATDILKAGSTYDIDLFIEATLVTSGTVQINSISDYDCPVPVPASASK
ncbi:hypothetical protein ACXWTF_12115 [Thiomicrolovo sp. ZZH C-3]